ncbi:MAG: HIT family protein [Planctomycetota bacterium]|jgi:histidine triad (HIT) family protein
MADNDCIFCKIVGGGIPAEVICRDEAAVAFMDIGPLAEGHVLLIPTGHHATLDQMPAEEAAAMLRHLPALVRAVQAATGCAGVNVLQNNGRAAHQVVEHVHFHVIPRNSGDAFQFNWPAGAYPDGRMAELAAAIRGHLAD